MVGISEPDGVALRGLRGHHGPDLVTIHRGVFRLFEDGIVDRGNAVLDRLQLPVRALAHCHNYQHHNHCPMTAPPMLNPRLLPVSSSLLLDCGGVPIVGAVGAKFCSIVGARVGSEVVGDGVGDDVVPTSVGWDVVGKRVGSAVGVAVGTDVAGLEVGIEDGDPVGREVMGAVVGNADGNRVGGLDCGEVPVDGASIGNAVGQSAAVGSAVGALVGTPKVGLWVGASVVGTQVWPTVPPSEH